MASANFPGNSRFRLETRTATWNQTPWNGGNSNLIHSELWIIKNSASAYWSYAGGQSWSMYIAGALVGSGGFTYDFRNSDSLLLHSSENWFAADGNGYMAYSINGNCNADLLGNVSVYDTGYSPRIPQPPLAPVARPIQYNITSTSFLFQFDGQDLRGGNLLRWEYQWSTSPTFASGNSAIFTSSGTSTVTGLPSGTAIYVRARAVTDVSNSPWSNTVSATTLSSLKVSVGGAWITPSVLVSDGTQWLSPEVRVSQGGAWVTPLP